MPNIIDSLFLELGIDTSKFSKDQQAALGKIAEFEKRSKKSAKGASQAVKTVGEAFRDIADDSRIGTGAHRLDTLATKLKGLGQAAQVSGGAGTPLGKMAEGLGALLSPATLALAAVGMLGKGVWDFDKKMAAANATIFRQAQLSGMNAKNLYAWGEAAKAVGANPQDVTGGISSLQTAVTGMGIGAGNATAQLIALSRLGGVGWNFKTGVNIPELFERVHQLAAKSGFQNLGALRALTSPLMNNAMWNIATSPTFDPNRIDSYIKAMQPKSFGSVLASSLKSQEKWGLAQAGKDTLMERAYGATHSVFDAMAVGIQQLVGLVTSIWDFISHPGKAFHQAEHTAAQIAHGAAKGWKTGGLWGAVAGGVGGYRAATNASVGRRMQPIVQALMLHGLSRADAEAMAGNFVQESSLDPQATKDYGRHMGLAQWDRKRQALFRKRFGYRMGSGLVPLAQQVHDQTAFAVWELHNTAYGREALKHMRAAKTLQGKVNAVNAFYERSGEVGYLGGNRYGILGPGNMSAAFARLRYARDARAAAASHFVSSAHSRATTIIHHSSKHHTVINGGISVNTPATDAKGIASGMRGAISAHPLIDRTAQHETTLATSAVAG